MPHWGRELTLLPATWQRGIARKWLKDWHWIVGSHTHCPQPLEAADGRLIAYSMGNLCWGAVPNWPLVGLAIRCEVGTRPDGTWALGSCRWAFVRQLPEGASQLRLVLQEACPFVRAA